MTNNTPTLQILSTIAVRKVLEVIVPEFEIWHGAKVEVSWGATLEQRDRILAGARADVAIITADAVRELDLKTGDSAVALIKATEVMIVRP